MRIQTNLILANQSGFTKTHNTASLFIRLLSCGIFSATIRAKVTLLTPSYASARDLFDTVDHDILIRNLLVSLTFLVSC